ncbi:tetratricopeptide repeat (TPR)-containing protein [Euphorbia peplus]|nr:tetratricopeptide repeat (TPR)-containing protein [Euphorbia peplus]
MMLCNYSHSVNSSPEKKLLRPASTVAKSEEIRVCTNRTCRRQGSFQTLEIIRDLSPPHISVNSCGCLGRCGAGPNVAFLPDGIILGHCATAASAARVVAGDDVDGDAIGNALEALAIRKRAEVEIDVEDFSEAEILLSQAIHLKPFGGLHITYKYRSSVRLAMGNYLGALEDAREALNLAPQYVEGYMCEGDVLVAMEQYDAAEKSYSLCLEIDPTIRRSKAFKSRVAKLQEKLTGANMPNGQQ